MGYSGLDSKGASNHEYGFSRDSHAGFFMKFHGSGLISGASL